MEYYGFAHKDTVLPSRFPIGLEELVKTFTAEQLRSFYEKHYRLPATTHPLNLTYYTLPGAQCKSRTTCCCWKILLPASEISLVLVFNQGKEGVVLHIVLFCGRGISGQ